MLCPINISYYLLAVGTEFLSNLQNFSMKIRWCVLKICHFEAAYFLQTWSCTSKLHLRSSVIGIMFTGIELNFSKHIEN